MIAAIPSFLKFGAARQPAPSPTAAGGDPCVDECTMTQIHQMPEYKDNLAALQMLQQQRAALPPAKQGRLMSDAGIWAMCLPPFATMYLGGNVMHLSGLPALAFLIGGMFMAPAALLYAINRSDNREVNERARQDKALETQCKAAEERLKATEQTLLQRFSQPAQPAYVGEAIPAHAVAPPLITAGTPPTVGAPETRAVVPPT